MRSLSAAILALLVCFTAVNAASPDRSLYPAFNEGRDILICQFDNRADVDDVHTQAAVGSMLQHPDFTGVDVYAVMGATGMQGKAIIDSTALMSDIFGPQGNENWTDARSPGERTDSPNNLWLNSVIRVKNKVKPILQNGGNVWVLEAGQSHITADWIQALQGDGINQQTCRNHIFIVQHSGWNHANTRDSDKQYLLNNAHYIRIDDGNHSADDTGNAGNDTADYETDGDANNPEQIPAHSQLRIDARTTANPNATTRSYWAIAEDIIAPLGFNESYSVIPLGGIDFSDTSEAWYIFELGRSLDTVDEFFDYYVMADNNGRKVFQEAGGVVVMDIESAPAAKNWDVWTGSDTLGPFLGDSYYVANIDARPTTTQMDTFKEGIMEYWFKIENQGEYQLQWRSHLTDGSGNPGGSTTDMNDSFVRLVDVDGNDIGPANIPNDYVPYGYEDQNSWYKIYQNRNNRWHWDAKNHDNNPKSVAWDLEAGNVYCLRVAARSMGHAIDRILLWNRSAGYTRYGDITKGATTSTHEATADALPLSGLVSGDETPLLTKFYVDAVDVNNITSGTVPFELDPYRPALQIDAAVLGYREKWARAIVRPGLQANTYDVRITAMKESDGESPYRVLVNGNIVGISTNDRIGPADDYDLQYHVFKNIVVPEGARVAVESQAVSNGLIAEATGFAYSRGRWTELAIDAPGTFNTTTNQPVTISITSHNDGDIVSALNDVVVTADAGDDSGIKRVWLSLDGTWISDDMTAPYEFNLGLLAPGEHALRVRAVANDTDAAIQDITIHVAESNYAPTVEFISPLNGDDFLSTAEVVVAVDAADDSGIDRVALRLDGALISTDREAPYEWSLGSLTAGTHTLWTRAFSIDGAYVNTEITIEVLPADSGPQLAFMSPTGGSQIAGSEDVIVRVAASDDSGLDRVALRLDDVLISADRESPYEWNLGRLSVGSHTLWTRAFAVDGGVTTTQISIDVVNEGPTLYFRSHVDGETVSSTEALIAKIEASDEAGMKSVELFLDGNSQGTRFEGPFDWDLGILPEGIYALRAEGVNNGGGRSVQEISVEVVKVSSGATVSIVSHENGQIVASNTELTVKLNALDDSGIARTRLYLDGNFMGVERIAPYEWDLGILSAGSHTLVGKAYANDGDIATTTITIEVEGAKVAKSMTAVVESDSGSSGGGCAMSSSAQNTESLLVLVMLILGMVMHARLSRQY